MLSAIMLVWFCLLQSESPVAEQTDESLATGTVNVQQEDLLAQPVGANWISYNGDYTGRRYSSLREITTRNVGQLREAWVFHPGNSTNLEVTPVVIRGIMFVTSANNVFALDARTGRTLWHYERPVSSGLLDDAAAHKNRGVAVWHDSIYSETDDAHQRLFAKSTEADRKVVDRVTEVAAARGIPQAQWRWRGCSPSPSSLRPSSAPPNCTISTLSLL